MMQITGKPSPSRGLTARLAPMLVGLVLGAGLALSGCGDDDSTTTTPAPAPAPAPPAPAPTPTLDAPAGLTVASSGTDYIEFSWEAVEGASGYEIQLSTTEGDFSSVSTASVTGTMHRFSVEPGTTAYARVRAVSDEANDSDWTEAVTGMSNAAPLVLAVPTVRVKATGVDFVEWEWDAVENAQGYQLQVADSEDGLDMAELERVTVTSHRVTVEPETTMYIRVRAGVLLPAPTAGDWSAAVAATSDVAPSPLTVSMSPPDRDADRACLGQPFCPDSGKDAKTAMATVNTGMMVTSSHSARITPMFMEGAGSVVVSAGSDRTPFAHVSWSATQLAVARDGAVFKFEKVSVGAGQEPTPTGDAAYITCGPFRCSDAAMEVPAAPDITLADSAACTEFEATLDLVKGIASNGAARDTVGEGIATTNIGLDFGFTYTATHAATVTHEFTGLASDGGSAYRVNGGSVAPASTPTGLPLAPRGAGRTAVNHFGGALNRDDDDDTQDQPGPIRNGYDSGDPVDCYDEGNLAPPDFADRGYEIANSSLGRVIGRLKRPEHCARLITDGIYEEAPAGKASPNWRNYLTGYRVRFTPTAVVAWGGSAVAWSSLEDDPFDGLACPDRTFEVTDLVDVCRDFEDEVDAYWGEGIGAGGPFQVEYTASAAGVTVATHALTHIVIRNKANSNSAQRGTEFAYRPRGSRHAHMWLVDSRATGAGIDGTPEDPDLYLAVGNENARLGADADLEGSGGSGDWRPLMVLDLRDEDGDPKYGDFGKVDFDGNGKADNTTAIDDDASRACTASDGGAGCDAEMTFDLSATFTRIRDTDACTRTIEQSITCTWDADGDKQRGGTNRFDVQTGANESPDRNFFIRCEPS